MDSRTELEQKLMRGEEDRDEMLKLKLMSFADGQDTEAELAERRGEEDRDEMVRLMRCPDEMRC
jgi:hypothetical protein